MVGVIGVSAVMYWWYNLRPVPLDLSEAHTVTRNSVKETLSLSGRIDATDKADVKYLTSGRLAWVGVEEGDRVEQSQALAALDQRELQKSFQMQLNTFRKTRNVFDQAVDDNEDFVYEEAEIGDRLKRLIDNAQVDLDNSVLALEMQQLAMEYATLIAPVGGLVTNVNTPNTGANVTAGTVGFTIMNPDSVYFSGSADQADVVALQEGLTGSITLDSYPEEDVPAIIRSISFTPKDGEIGTVYEVTIDLLDRSLVHKLRIGMTGDVDFITSETDGAIAIPNEYIFINQEGNSFVYRVIDGEDPQVEEHVIEIGLEGDDYSEVVSGLSEGDMLLPQAE